jgi:hypothetical protein
MHQKKRQKKSSSATGMRSRISLHSIANYLTDRKHSVFVDTQMQVGTKWVEEIEQQIRKADYFVVLLSKVSVPSQIIRREVKLAHQMSQRKKTAHDLACQSRV